MVLDKPNLHLTQDLLLLASIQHGLCYLAQVPFILNIWLWSQLVNAYGPEQASSFWPLFNMVIILWHGSNRINTKLTRKEKMLVS